MRRPGLSDGMALGCRFRVVTAAPAAIDRARAAVDEVLAAVDLACSRFRPDSEIAEVNAAAGSEVELSPLLNRAITAALRAAAVSEGTVDPTVGEAVRLAGYDSDFAKLPADGAAVTLVAQRVPGWRLVAHDPQRRRLRAPAGVELDLGATAKALAADLSAAAAFQRAGGGVLVSLGGDIATAGDGPAGGWPIQISEDSGAPMRPGEETISIRAGGLATSSTTVRRWKRGGVELHHLIDPATSSPVEGPWRTATVIAATCVDANTASTAAIVKGVGAADWLGGKGLAARLVGVDGSVVKLGGWP